ncbi:hypothetical protein PINS_up004903 [Pythium insidiosum]|nr:hypothetical protein PINS_up004903 [Pythium insidiosum]
MLRRLFRGAAPSSRVLAVVDDDADTNGAEDTTANPNANANANAEPATARHRSSSVRPRTARSSFGFRSLVDATVDDPTTNGLDDDDDHEEDDAFDVDAAPLPSSSSFSSAAAVPRPESSSNSSSSSSPRRRTRRISTVERLLVEKTSAILSNPLAHVAVHLHGEIKRRRQQVERAAATQSRSSLAATATALSRSSLLRPFSQRLSRWSERENASAAVAAVASKTASAHASPSSQRPTGSSTATELTLTLTLTRLRLQRFIKSRVFRALLFAVVFLDMVVLALDDSGVQREDPARSRLYSRLDIALTALLVLEIVLKSVAFGLWHGPEAYLRRNKFRVLNVLLLVGSLLSYIGGPRWRILRGLKTYRSLTLYGGLRRILKSLLRAIPFLANVATLALFFLLAFSVFGLEAYRDAYSQQCVWTEHVRGSSTGSGSGSSNDVVWEALPRKYCSESATCGGALGGRTCATVAPPSKHVNFDTGLTSLFLVFIVVAQDGWVGDIMAPVVQATSWLSTLFFVAIVVTLVFLVVNLFVAVITTSFMNFAVEESGASGDDDATRARCSLTKMDPEAEETRVGLILGATLAIEETLSQAAAANADSSSMKGAPAATTTATTATATATTIGAAASSAVVDVDDAAVDAEAASSSDSVGSTTTASSAQALAPSSRPGSAPQTRLLPRTHHFRSMRNLTVETTIELLQNAATVEEFLAQAIQAADSPPPTTMIDAAMATPSDPVAIAIAETDGVAAASSPPLTTALPPLVVPANDPAVTAGAGAGARAEASPPRPSSALVVASSPFASLSLAIGLGANRGGDDAEDEASWSPRFKAFRAFVLSKRFDDFITMCIVVNTLFLLAEYPNMPAALRTTLSVTEYLFGSIFLLEMVLRVVALRGVRAYLRSTERFFDFIVVLCTSLNMLFNNLPSVTFSGLNSVSSLRTLRVTRLMLKWDGTRKLIASVLRSSRGIMDVVVFLFLFQVANSLVGMQLFGGGDHLTGDSGEAPRWSFDSFGRAFLTLLQVITGDQWSSITYDAVNAEAFHWFLVPFLVLNFIFGQYVLLNLFIAVILENFSISEEEAYQLQLEQIIAIPKELDIYEKIEEEGVRAFGEMERLDNVSNVKLRMFLGLDDQQSTARKTSASSHNLNAPTTPSSASPCESATSASASSSTSTFSSAREASGHAPGGTVIKPPRRRKGKRHASASHQTGVARWLSLWRRLCRRVANAAWFSRLMMLTIFASCLTLVLEEPHPEMRDGAPVSRAMDAALQATNAVVLVFLALEFVVKVSSAGFGWAYLRVVLFHHDETLGFVRTQAYMEDRWNQLDFVLLLLAFADEAITAWNPALSAARVVRAGRVLRPLRVLSRNQEMKSILRAVAHSLPQVGNVFALCSLVYVIFGVVGRSLFSGKFYSCNDASVTRLEDCVGFYLVQPDGAQALQEATAKGVLGGSILMPRVWAPARFSFDNIGAGFLTLLEMTSLKWVDKTFAAMDIAGQDKQPVQDAAPQNALFFVLFVYVGSLFVIRLFVGVLVEQFQRNNGTQILTESQKSWVDLEKFVLLLKPLKRIPRPATALQNRLFDVCRHAYFTRVIAVAILLNVLLLLFNPVRNGSNSGTLFPKNSEESSASSSSSFRIVEMLFLAVFSLEALCKCLAFRQYYVLSATGAFELLILSGSIVAFSFASGMHSVIQTGRVFRMLRVLRFVRLNRGVYTVFQTFRGSLRPIGHIFSLLLMIFFIFAIVGRQLFGGVRLGPALTGFSNFRSFGSSFLLLFQILSGDDWHLTMTDCSREKPACVERWNPQTRRWDSDCGSAAGAVAFFVTFVTLVVFVFLNLFIAVILENFRSCYLQGDVCPISLHDFELYREVFLRYDAKGDGMFPLWQLASFLAELPPGLRIDRRTQRTAFLQVRSQVQALQESCLTQRCKRPFFNELLRALCIQQLGIRSLPYEQQRDRVKQIFIYRAKVANMLVESMVQGYVQRWRRRKERERMAQLRERMTPETALVGGGQLYGADPEPPRLLQQKIVEVVALATAARERAALLLLQQQQEQQQEQQEMEDAKRQTEAEEEREVVVESTPAPALEATQADAMTEQETMERVTPLDDGVQGVLETAEELATEPVATVSQVEEEAEEERGGKKALEEEQEQEMAVVENDRRADVQIEIPVAPLKKEEASVDTSAPVTPTESDAEDVSNERKKKRHRKRRDVDGAASSSHRHRHRQHRHHHSHKPSKRKGDSELDDDGLNGSRQPTEEQAIPPDQSQ